MQHQESRDWSGTEPAERGSGSGGKPAGAGSWAVSVESQLVELKTRVGALEAQAERSENRWEKWRSEDQRRHEDLRKDVFACFRQADEKLEEHKKETAAGFQRVDEKLEEQRKETAAGFQQVGEKFEKVDEKFEAMGRETAACFRRVGEKLEEAKKATDEQAQKFIRRAEMLALLILAAILGTGVFG